MKSKLTSLLLIFLLLSGCASWNSSSILRNDVINTNAGFNSVVILRIKLIDETQSFENLGNLNLWENYIGISQKDNRMAQLILGTEGKWKTAEESKYLEKTVFLETISGIHTLQSLSFSYDTIDNSKMRRITHTITMPIKRDYTVPAGSIVYLGELEIVVKTGGVFDHRFRYDEKQKKFSVKAFSKLFPVIYKQYKTSILTIQPTLKDY